jgi:Mycothiol maleylpyruvate isomerase N-terminal domain
LLASTPASGSASPRHLVRLWMRSGTTRSGRGAAPGQVFQRWREARLDAVAALRAADPQQPLSWVEAPLKPATPAATCLAEHWAHAGYYRALGIDFPDTARLRHIAWLAHRSLSYAFALTGEHPHESSVS